MDSEVIIWIVVAVVVVLAVLAVVAVLLRRKRQADVRRRLGHADELRHQAAGQSDEVRVHQQRAAAADAEARAARERAERAERGAAAAHQEAAQAQARQEDVIREADQVDPRVDHRSGDYRPTTDPGALKDPLPPADPADDGPVPPPEGQHRR